METVKPLAKSLFRAMMPLMDWAITNWMFTLGFLALLIFWASHGRFTQNRH